MGCWLSVWKKLCGDYQAYKAKGGDYTREHFFGKYPELAAMVANMSDEDIWRLNRGGHDPIKVYAAFKAASEHQGQPTVILAKTVKGYGMGGAGEGQNITHSQKKMGEDSLRHFRDRFNIPIPDQQIASAPYYKPSEDSEEMKYLHARRKELGGYLPARRDRIEAMDIPGLDTFKALLDGSGDREMSTTMAFVRFLSSLIRDKQAGKHVVPIVSCLMKRALLVWKACSANLASIPMWGSCTRRWIRIRSCITGRTSKVRFCRKVSMRRAPCLPGLPLPLPIPAMAWG